jgi:hypothetical protein
LSNTFYNLIIGLCSAIVALVTFGSEIAEYFKILFFKKIGFKVILTGIAFVFGIWATIAKDNANDQKNDKDKIEAKESAKKEQKALRGDNEDLKRQLLEANFKIQGVKDSLSSEKKSLEEQNYKLSQALTETSLDLKRNIVGGEGPIYIDIGTSYDSSGYLVLYNKSNLPVSSVDIDISDFEKMSSCKISPRKDMLIIDAPCFRSCTVNFTLGSVMPGSTHVDGYYALPSKKFGTLEIRFMLRSGKEYLEQLVYVRHENAILTSGRLLILTGSHYKFLLDINTRNIPLKIDFDKVFNLPLTSRTQQPITWR